MKVQSIFLASILVASIASNAGAITIDNKSLTNSDGSAQFTDPEDDVQQAFGPGDNQSSGSDTNGRPVMSYYGMTNPGSNTATVPYMRVNR